MERQESTIKKDKRKTQISLGGGDGIGGMLVLGGALAVAGLIFFFTIKNRRRDANKEPKIHKCVTKESKKNFFEDEGSEGLRCFLSQTSSSTTHNSCFMRYGTSEISVAHIDPSETILVHTKSLIMEEKPMTEISKEKEDTLSGPQEIILSDDSKPESIASCDDCGVNQECSLLASERTISIEKTLEKNDFNFEAMITAKVEKQDEEYLTAYAEEMAVQEDSPMQSAEEEEEKDEDDEDEEEEWAAEKGEESSEGTGYSSMESNDEVWPAELITEKSSQELKKTHRNFLLQNPQATTKEEEEDNTVKAEEYGSSDSSDDADIFNNSSDESDTTEEPVMSVREKKPVMVKKQPAPSSQLRIWIFSMSLLVLLILLLSFTHPKAMSYYKLYLNSSIIREA
ncbi:glutamic acid-rich protein-like [Fagus crenata]